VKYREIPPDQLSECKSISGSYPLRRNVKTSIQGAFIVKMEKELIKQKYVIMDDNIGHYS